MCRLAKGESSPVLHEDPDVTLTSPPEIQKSSGYSYGSGTGSGSWLGSGSGWDPVGEGDRHELLEEGVEGAIVAERNVLMDSFIGFGGRMDLCRTRIGWKHLIPLRGTLVMWSLDRTTTLYSDA
ncbi:hypothetical protein M9H77_21278 [Catharanthus roseus]|uniref:Uncharacterized protein n=1 Tax=Catharanthus roseus TaxID=4058 RepID=A0ACC0ANW8_CATRO|nr:hypothetical protein M9H77_21278 [Catharanthus roseus]